MREFAKRERANSWQSKGKFAFKFMDCHAVFCEKKTAHKGKLKDNLCVLSFMAMNSLKSALLKAISSKNKNKNKKDFLNHRKKPFQALPQVR